LSNANNPFPNFVSAPTNAIPLPYNLVPAEPNFNILVAAPGTKNEAI